MAHLLKKDDVLTVDSTDKVQAAASWDASSRGKSGFMGKASKKAGADLDAGAILMQEGNPVRMAWMDNTNPCKNGSVVHSGDNTTGAGEGDDEVIDIRLGEIPVEYDGLVLFVAAFKATKGVAKLINSGADDQGFHGADNVEMVLRIAGDEFKILPSLLGRENVCLLGRLERVEPGNPVSQWTVRKLQEMRSIPHGDRNALLHTAKDV